MKKLLLFLSLTLIGVSQASAYKVSELEAYEIAQKFLSGKSFASRSASSSNDLKLVETSTSYYAFSKGESNGYVIVAADNEYFKDEIIGYSDNGTFDPNNMPPNMRWWLSEYDRGLEYMQSNGIKPQAMSAQAVSTQAAISRASYTNIAPLIKSAWGQDDPYNGACPENTATGCVPTALSQIIYYHKYPTTDANGNTYEYDKMLTSYTSESSQESKDAVANLMRKVGDACGAVYGSETSATSPNGLKAIVNTFNYDKSAVIVQRDYYSLEMWSDMLYSSLSAGYPIYYSGFTSLGGAHAFVCDGYENGKFHFNWGWYGSYDGYFAIDALNPLGTGTGGGSGSYNQSQLAILNLKPAEEGSKLTALVYCNQKFSINGYEQTFTSEPKITGCFFNANDLGKTTVTLGLKVVNTATNEVTWIPGSYTGQPTVMGTTSFTVPMSQFPTENGTYHVHPAYRVEDTGVWNELYVYRAADDNRQHLLIATVSGTTISFANASYDDVAVAPALELSLSSWSIENQTSVPLENVKITANVTCESGDCTNNEFELRIIQGTSTICTKSQTATIASGSTQAILFSGTFTGLELGQTYTASLFHKKDGNWTQLGSSTEFTTASAASELQLTIASVSMNAESMSVTSPQISISVKCVSGSYNGSAKMIITQGTNKICESSAKNLSLTTTGASKTVIFYSDSFSGLAKNQTYTVTFYYRDPNNYNNWIQLGDARTFKTESDGSEVETLTMSLSSLVIDNATSVPVNNPNITATIGCTSGSYTGKVKLAITQSSSTTNINVEKDFTIASGGSKSVTFGASDITGLEAGQVYSAAIFYQDGTNWIQLGEAQTFTTTEASEPETDPYCPITTVTGSGYSNVYVTSIISSGTNGNELNYTASSRPADYIILENGLIAAQGQTFTINLKGFNTDDGSNNIIYTHAEVYADWNCDHDFSGTFDGVTLPGTANSTVYGNTNDGSDEDILMYGALDAESTGMRDWNLSITIPADATPGVSRIRIKYTDAWHTRASSGGDADHGPCVTPHKGIVYDIPLTIEAAAVEELSMSLASLTIDNATSVPVNNAKITANVTCSSGSYDGLIKLAITKGTSTICEPTKTFSIAKNGSQSVVFTGTDISGLEKGQTYNATILYQDGTNWIQLGDTQTFTTEPEALSMNVASFVIANATSVPVDNPNISVTIECASGSYEGLIRLELTKGTSVSHDIEKTFSITKGDSKTITWNADDITGLVAGEIYSAAIQYQDGTKWVQIGDVQTFTTAAVINYYEVIIDNPTNGAISVVNADNNSEIEDLGNVREGTRLKVSATALTGYVLASINITTNGTTTQIANEQSFTLSGNTTISATFVKESQLVTITIADPEDAGTSTISVYNGTTQLFSGDKVASGTTITFTNHASDGYEFINYTINDMDYSAVSYTIRDNITISAVFNPVVPFPEVNCTSDNRNCSDANQRSMRRLINFAIGDDTQEVTINVNQAADNDKPSYFDKTTSILETSPGATIEFKSIDWNSGEWMHGYVYVDYNSNGSFNTTLNADGKGDGEVVSYTYYNVNDAEYGDNASAPNSRGIVVPRSTAPVKITNNVSTVNMPNFTLPTDLAPGDYRARFKIDWNSLDPCGSEVESASGAMVDFIIRIPAPEVVPNSNALTVSIESGDGAWFVSSDITTAQYEEKPGVFTTISVPAGNCYTEETGIPATGKFYIFTTSMQPLTNVFVNNGGSETNCPITRGTSKYWENYKTVEPQALISTYNDWKYYYYDDINGDIEIKLSFDPSSSIIDSIVGEGNETDEEVEYYNLQGVRVSSENLAPGFYIVRQGAKAKKVYINN